MNEEGRRQKSKIKKSNVNGRNEGCVYGTKGMNSKAQNKGESKESEISRVQIPNTISQAKRRRLYQGGR